LFAYAEPKHYGTMIVCIIEYFGLRLIFELVLQSRLKKRKEVDPRVAGFATGLVDRSAWLDVLVGLQQDGLAIDVCRKQHPL
jgi:hypothetical protein